MLECGNEVKRTEGKPVPVREQLEEAEGRRKGIRRVGQGEVERLQEREKGLEMVERLDVEIWAYKDQCKDGKDVMKQLAALPGHLGLQAAHLCRDGPGLLLQPLITSLASPFLASSLLLVKQGGAKNTKVSDFQNGKALSNP